MSDETDAAGQENPRHEMLSALLDGEASEFETRRLLQSLDAEDEKKWRSYSLIQQSMQASGDEPLNLSIDVSAAVSAEIDKLEPLSHSPSQVTSASPTHTAATASADSPRLRLIKPLIGFAAAASFAFVSVIGFEQYQSTTGDAGFVAQGDVSASQLNIQGGTGLSAVSGQVSIPVDQLQQDIDDIEQQKLRQQQRLNYYMQQHAEQATLNNGQHMLPMVRAAEDEQ